MVTAARHVASTTDPEWGRLFTEFEHSAFRLEGLQRYTEPGETESFAKFCAGEDPQIQMGYWLGLAAAHKAAGRTMARVRVIVEPPSDYTRFELSVYPAMSEAGDEVRIISTTADRWPADLPHHDFWLFDDRHVWILDYDDVGFMRGADLYDDPQTVAQHVEWRDNALARSIAVKEYLAAPPRVS